MSMPNKSLLVANRGEVAVRVLRAAAELNIRTVAVFSEDDSRSLHTRKADEVRPLRGTGPGAYLDGEQLLAVARESGCGMIHAGYGFLSESSPFAARCEDEGFTFVGPDAATLDIFGDKGRARALAQRLDVPILPGTSRPTSLAEAREFLASLGSRGVMLIKAIAGGGGRGLRTVSNREELEEAYERCRSEAQKAFGNGDVYVERFLTHARHLEVQIIGDGSGGVVHLGERDCSLQRRHQKLVEVAPAPGLSSATRERLSAAAVRLASEVGYRSVGTVEFLIDADLLQEDLSLAFIEINPRLQVEHTVTEEVTELDLVKLQLRIAEGATLEELGLDQERAGLPRGIALQARVNMERLGPDGTVKPSAGTLTAYEPPTGPGVRVDTFGYSGYRTTTAFDSLLAKVIVRSRSGDLADVTARAYRALCEFRIEGVHTNIPFLQNMLRHSEVTAGHWYTQFVEDHVTDLAVAEDGQHRRLFFGRPEYREEVQAAGLAGAAIDTSDPLAVLSHGKSAVPETPTSGKVTPMPTAEKEAPTGTVAVCAPLQGTVVSIAVRDGDTVQAGAELLVMESMKMEHVVRTSTGGTVRRVDIDVGDTVLEDHPLLFMEQKEVAGGVVEEKAPVDLDHIRPDLAESIERHGFGLDENRPDVVERRRQTGQRTARENIDDLCDPGSFAEYGALVIAAQRGRRELDDLIRRTPGDGLICGIGRVNGDLFPDDRAQCVVMSYDYSVLAGTQGLQNHRKKDRMFEIARQQRLPVVILTEGGGGRPGDTDTPVVAGLNCLAFRYFGGLSGLVPLVGINSRYCFAGNAALLGCCDVIIATENSSIGMGGPAMIEGGGLGAFHPAEVGPMAVQVHNGVVDIAVKDEEEAVSAAKRYLAYFQGPLADWEAADQRLLRTIIPENRLRIYDVRTVIETLADTGSVLELRRPFGPGMVTALARIEGRPLGVIANNPTHLAGAIDPDGADKAARFMQLCDAFDLPILFLCDTPGIMVGPEVEKQANVRHASRMFVVGASLSVPFFTIVLRKGYGLGAQAMAGGSFHAPTFTVAWPTGEFGAMGLEGAAKLGFRNDLAAIEDPAERTKRYDQMVAYLYEIGKAVSIASHFEIDDVIDPKDSRHWILTALRSVPESPPREGKKRPCIDSW